MAAPAVGEARFERVVFGLYAYAFLLLSLTNGSRKRVAADTRRRRLALRHVIKAAACHMTSDVPDAKLARACLGQGYDTESDHHRESRHGRAC